MKPQIQKKADGQFEITRMKTEVYDRTGLVQRRRHAQAELDSVEIDLERLNAQKAALKDELSQITALLDEVQA